MKKVRIHTPKTQTTLPRHEQKARRTRAKTERPSTSRKSRHTATARRPDSHSRTATEQASR